MGVRDRSLDYLRTSKILDVGDFKFPTFAAGGPVLSEIGTTGLAHSNVAAAGDTWACIDFNSPRDWNPDADIGVRVHYVTKENAIVVGDTVSWIVTYKQFDSGDTLTAPVTALTTVVPLLHAPGATVAGQYAYTNRGIIAAGTLPWSSRLGGFAWAIEADAFTYAADEIGFVGLEIDYMPKRYIDGNEDEEVWMNRAATSA
jgi:hypothetical protein